MSLAGCRPSEWPVADGHRLAPCWHDQVVGRTMHVRLTCFLVIGSHSPSRLARMTHDPEDAAPDTTVNTAGGLGDSAVASGARAARASGSSDRPTTREVAREPRNGTLTTRLDVNHAPDPHPGDRSLRRRSGCS